MQQAASCQRATIGIFGHWFGRFVLPSALALFACAVHGATVLNTFAGPGTTATGASWRLGGDDDPHAGNAGQAVGFRLDSAATIDSIVTTIEGTGVVRLSIVGDLPNSGPDFGLPFGATYFSTSLTNPTSLTLLDGLHVPLSAGRYWLVAVEAPGSTFRGGWQGGGDSVTSPWRFYMSRLDWVEWGPQNPPAALITSTVPEPRPGFLMMGGLAAIGLAALFRPRLRRRAGG